jgi:type IV pilus assembly protein PilM
MWSSNSDLVGLDIGSSCIKLVQLSHTHKGYVLKNLAVESIPPQLITHDEIKQTDEIADILTHMFRRNNIKNTNVAVGVSGPSVSVKKVTMPYAPSDELADMVRWEADQYVPFDTSEAYIDFQLLPLLPETKKMEVILVAAKKERVQSLLEVVQKAGLQPIIVDSEAMALENQYGINYHPTSHELVALLDIGASTINLNILKNGSTIFANSSLGGGNDFTRAIQQELNVSDEEAEQIKRGKGLTGINISLLRKVVQQVSAQIVNQVEYLLNCFIAGHPEEGIPKILLSGGVSLFQGFSRFLTQQLDWPVSLANPLKEIAWHKGRHIPEDLAQLAPLAAVGVGLALRRAGRERL